MLSLQKFLFIYYGVPYRSTVNMKHEDVKDILEFVVRTSFEHADKNPELVETGKIIYVRDTTNREFPYMVPEPVLEECEVEMDSLDELYERQIEEHLNLDEIDLDCCSLWELKQLLVANKKRYGVRRKIFNEIRERNGQKGPVKRKGHKNGKY